MSQVIFFHNITQLNFVPLCDNDLFEAFSDKLSKRIILMKKVLLYFCLLSTALLLFAQYSSATADATPGQGCRGQRPQGQQPQVSAEAKEKYEAFLLETADLRRELEEKKKAYQFLMTSDSPDASQVALLTEQYYQLRDFITEKAVLAGLMQKRQGCNGCSGKSGVACGLPSTKSGVENTN